MTDDELKESKKEKDRIRGRRLKRLRSMSTLTASELAKRAGVSRVIISYWENADKSPLSEQGARKVIAVFREVGIDCSFDWLWEGKGLEPKFIQNEPDVQVLTQVGFLFPSIEKEIELFTKLNQHAVILKIDSVVYSPFFEFNDIVAGKWQPIETLNSPCFSIININNVNKIKWLKKINDNKRVQISNLPLVYQKNENKIEDVEIDQFAPIIRIWR